MVSAMVWVRFEPGSTLHRVGPIPANLLKSRPFLGIALASHLNGVQGVAGSNPAVPTEETEALQRVTAL